jgi:MIP family channel proteins
VTRWTGVDSLYGLLQKLAAEFIGTFAIVFVAAGAACADRYLQMQTQPSFGLIGIALAYGLATAVMVSSFAHVSGGHLNPAVTIACWVTRRSGTLRSLFYCVAQLLGALLAAYLLLAIVPEQVWRPIGMGTPDLATDFTRLHAMLLEGALAFLVVLAYFATVLDQHGILAKVGGFAVGLMVMADVLLGAPFVGTSAANPARNFGTALVSRHWQNQGVFWVGPLFGGVIAGVIYDRLFLNDQPPS